MEPDNDTSLPPGWRRYQNNRGRIQYDSPPPVTQIRTKGELIRYQKQGKFAELDADNLNFLVTRKKKKKSFVILETLVDISPTNDLPDNDSPPNETSTKDPPTNDPFANDSPPSDPSANETSANETSSKDPSVNDPLANDTTDNDSPANIAAIVVADVIMQDVLVPHPAISVDISVPQIPSSVPSSLASANSGARTKTINKEMSKINAAVELLKIDETKNLNHKEELQKAAKLLNETRKPKEFETNLEDLKDELFHSPDLESMVHRLWSNPEARAVFQQIETSSSLEDFLHMGRSTTNGPLKVFPPSVNANLYHEIIKFSLERSRSTVMYFLNMIVDRTKPVSVNDVIHVAFIISYLAHSVNRENDALAKLKALSLYKEGTTTEGLDAAGVLGVTESSRSLRNQKDFLAGIVAELVKSAAKTYPHQSTIDNLGKC